MINSQVNFAFWDSLPTFWHWNHFNAVIITDKVIFFKEKCAVELKTNLIFKTAYSVDVKPIHYTR